MAKSFSRGIIGRSNSQADDGSCDKSEEHDRQTYRRGPCSDPEQELPVDQKLALEVRKQAFRNEKIIPETSKQRRARSPQSPKSPNLREYRDRREPSQQPPPPPPPPPSQQCDQQLSQRAIQPVGWRPPGYQNRQNSDFVSNERRTFSQQNLALNRTPRPSPATIMQTHQERRQHEQRVMNHDAEMEALKRVLREKEVKAEERKRKKIKEETEQ